MRSRHGSGTYIPDGPPTLGGEALSFLAALHGFTREEVYEARRILEVGAAGLAAERATPEQLATLAEEVAGLFASLDDPQVFLVHDIDFHRGVAAASGNPIVASLVEMVVGAVLRAAARDGERARRIATCATRRTCTAASIRRSAPAMPTRARRRCTIIWCRRTYQSRRREEPRPARRPAPIAAVRPKHGGAPRDEARRCSI